MRTNFCNESLPIIDVSSAVTGEPSGSLVKEISAACETTGFFIAVNHGLDPALVENMHQVTRAFFRLNKSSKW